MKYKYNYDINDGVRFHSVSKEKKCPNAPIWINRFSNRGALFNNLKSSLIKWIKSEKIFYSEKKSKKYFSNQKISKRNF